MVAAAAAQRLLASVRSTSAPASASASRAAAAGPLPRSAFAGKRVALSAAESTGRGVTAAARTPTSMAVAAAAPPRLSDAAKPKLIDSVKAFIFDCDGVIWKGDSVIPGVPETLEMLRKAGKKLFFVTNNSTKSRKGYLSKFTSLGLNIQPEEIFSSSYAAAAYLSSIKFDKKVYVVGEVGIQEELDLVGIKHIGGPSDGTKVINLKPGEFMDHDKDVGAVVVGFDRYINYYKIQYATLCVRENPGCLFIATNTDAVTHLTDAQEWAGNGSMVGAIKGSTKKEPTVVGKPSSFMLGFIADSLGIARNEICMVGDRLDTDILFGKDGGLQTLLVLSGVTTEPTLLAPENKIHPDFYTDCLGDLLKK